jgi:hypothetical protein
VALTLLGNGLVAASFLGGGLAANGLVLLVIAAVGGERVHRFIVDGPVEFIGDEQLLRRLLADDAAIALASVVAIVIGAAIAVLGVGTGSKLRARGRRLRALDGRALLRAGARAPVLLLRSFDDDALADPRPLDFFALRYEERLAHALARAGPLLGVGRPGEDLGFSGAARIYVRDEDWQPAVRYLMERAAAVLVIVGPGQGRWWELEAALSTVARERLLFFFPYVHDAAEPASSTGALLEFLGRWNVPKRRHQRMRHLRLQRYRAFLRFTDLSEHLPADLGNALFVDFTLDGQPRLLRGKQRWFGFWNFMHVIVLPARHAQLSFDLRRTLLPFVRKVRAAKRRQSARERSRPAPV